MLYQVVHDDNLCGHIFSTPEISLSGAYAKLVVSLNNYCQNDILHPRNLFKWCILLILLYYTSCLIFSTIGLHSCYAYCIDIDCIPYTNIDIAYYVACILLFLSVYW